MRHVMVDIETLGTKPGSVILSIGACRFTENSIDSERFYRPIDVFDSLMAGLTVDPATVGWWRMQSEAARSALQPARPLRETLEAFADYIGQTDRGAALLWAKGPDFDLVMLDAAYTQLGMKKPWSYRAARDVRTLLALAPNLDVPASPLPAHHALGDAEDQAHQVIGAAAKLGVTLSEMV